MNASGRLNTCKSRGIIAILETGARVSNAYVTCPLQGDSPSKGGLILHKIVLSHDRAIKAEAVKDGHA